MNFKSFFGAPPVTAYWWKDVPNFGDGLAPLLLERFADIKVQWGTISHSKIASIGSVLEHIPPLWDGYVVGSGRLFEGSRIHMKGVKVLALRGPLSACGVSGTYGLGDPGLLSDELVGSQEKIWDVGIVPHWLDKDLVPRFKALVNPKVEVTIIEPRQNPLDVLRQIGACKQIVTSSLHGMIVADAFGIPRRVEICKRLEREGGTFKFRDYSASIQTPIEFGKVQEPIRGKVEDVKFAIYDALRELGKELK